jgi:hypothetical protein
MTPKGIVVVPIRKTDTERAKGIVKGKLSMKELENMYTERS